MIAHEPIETESIERRAGPVTPVRLSWAQGVYYFVTGVWPLVDVRSFQFVTGPKTDHLPTGREADHWLVMTVGVLVVAVGLSLLTAAWRRSVGLETVVLALAAAAGLMAIDVVYVARGVLRPIYLADAVVEAALIAGWVWWYVRSGRFAPRR